MHSDPTLTVLGGPSRPLDNLEALHALLLAGAGGSCGHVARLCPHPVNSQSPQALSKHVPHCSASHQQAEVWTTWTQAALRGPE